MINILVGAIIFAVWLVILFFGKSIGLSMILFTVPITYFSIYILEKNNKVLNKKAKILIIPIALLSSTYFIYNNNFFNILNIFVIPFLIIIMLWKLFDEKIKFNFLLIEKIAEMLFFPLSLFGEAFEKTKQSMEEKFKINSNSNKSRNTKKVFKAILITLPILLFIIFLLSSADSIFGSVFVQIMQNIKLAISKIQFSEILIKLICIIIAFIYLLGGFYYITQKYVKDENEDKKQEIKKDSFTIKMILGSLNIVYFLFCIIQIKVLFIGNTNLNYAEYARQGFFQLMIVSLINLITILFAKNNEKKSKYVNIMCITMIVFTFIILISSAYRMYLYESAYGYTLLRLLVYCSLFTEGVLLIPTTLYILNKNINLTQTYLKIIIVIYLCMNFANFDNIIAKRNVDRYMDTGKIDIAYLYNRTGADAIKEIIRLSNTKDFNEDMNQITKNYIYSVYNNLKNETMDFRDFNISKILALKSIEENYTDLDTFNETSTNETINVENPDRIIFKNDAGYYKINSDNENVKIKDNLTGTTETISGIVRSKIGDEIEISYSKNIWDNLGNVKILETTITNKTEINVGDWVEVTGTVSGISMANIKNYNATKINIIPEEEYQEKLKKYLVEKQKITTSIEYSYESEGRGDGYVVCRLNLGEYSSEPDAYLVIKYDENTESYLGMGRHLQSNYGIHKHEIVDITFNESVTNVNDITAKMFEYIAD